MSTTGNSPPEDARAAAAGRRLGELLGGQRAYRALWERRAVHHRGAAVHQGAVAAVLANQLWDTGQVPETDRDLPRRLKDVVSRALSGRVLSARTLRLFVEAFSMSDEHAAELSALRAGLPPPARPGATGAPAAGPVRATGRPLGVAGRDFTTVALHELHTLGPDGIPAEHRTVHVIRAVGTVARYRYIFDTSALQVRVLRGGVPGPVYPLGEMFAVDIEFARPLQPGETGSFEYVTTFGYTSAPEPVFRRGARGRIENVELHVRFHPDRLPDRIWWATWANQRTQQVSAREPVALEPDGSVHRFLPAIIGPTVVGFHWHFPPR